MTRPADPRFIPKTIHPTDEQIAIQLSQSKVTLIHANAGAAKTTTLALRIGEAIARSLAPEHMLALVFTPEARDVLKERMVEVGIARATAARVQVATFEEFAIAALEQIEQRKTPAVAQIKDLKSHVLAALQSVSDQYSGQLDYLDIDTSSVALSQFFHAQLELKATLRLQHDADGLSNEELSDVLGVPYSTYLTALAYEKIRQGYDGEVLFRGPFDATYDLACMLDADPSLRALLPRYRIILCDELHDLNEASFHLLQQLIEPHYTYFVGAGDIDQVIHARLGASDSFMRSRFRERYPATVTYPLTYSFRHGPHLTCSVEQFKTKPAHSLLALRTEIHQHYYDEAAGPSCAEQVVAAVRQWQRDGQKLGDCAILVREPYQSIAIENALMQAAILYRTQEMPRYLEREEILFLRGMMALALDNFASTKKSLRGAIFDAVATFAEVSFARDEDVNTLRQAVIDEPVALNWLFSGRVDQRGARDVADKVKAVVDQLQTSIAGQPADHVLGELRLQLTGLLEFGRGQAPHQSDPSLTQALDELGQRVNQMVAYLERDVMAVSATMLLQTLRHHLLSLLSLLEALAMQDVKQRMAHVLRYMQSLDDDARADVVLAHICALMKIEDRAKRLYVDPHEARVVTKSIAGFIAAAAKMQLSVRQFAEWIGNADGEATSKKTGQAVQIMCVRSAKGKEFEHVILPYLAQGEFPFEKAEPKEEDNLFYVAMTRVISNLTLISPKETGLRSAFVARMRIAATRARAEAALEQNEKRDRPTERIEFNAYGDDWAQVKALGAQWDHARKVFYLKAGQDPAPFARWLERRER
jgi:DNA helicase-2/ATP-dependent DNA helicase PcrA